MNKLDLNSALMIGVTSRQQIRECIKVMSQDKEICNYVFRKIIFDLLLTKKEYPDIFNHVIGDTNFQMLETVNKTLKDNYKSNLKKVLDKFWREIETEEYERRCNNEWPFNNKKKEIE